MRFAFIAVNHFNKHGNTYDTDVLLGKMIIMKLKTSTERSIAPNSEEYLLKGLGGCLEKHHAQSKQPNKRVYDDPASSPCKVPKTNIVHEKDARVIEEDLSGNYIGPSDARNIM